MSTGIGVYFPDQRPVHFGRHTAFSDIAIRADAHGEKSSVRAGRQRLGPMMVDRAGPTGDLRRRATGFGLYSRGPESDQRRLVRASHRVTVRSASTGTVQER